MVRLVTPELKAPDAGASVTPLPVASRGTAGKRTHDQLARHYLAEIGGEDGLAPVAVAGDLYRWDSATLLWLKFTQDQIALDVAQRYPDEKRCQTVRDYRALAQHIICIDADEGFFSDAPVGVAAGGSFYSVSRLYGLETEQLRPEHRQRFALPCVPSSDSPAEMLNKYLRQVFSGEDGAAQLMRAAELAGGVITRLLPSMQKAALILGPEGSGKSTIARLITALLPDDLVTATPPHQWGHEYYLASLAGSQLNVVGEVSHNTPIPGAAFKSVLGGDRLQGRHPNHRPIEFRNSAAHVFLGNSFPPTDDRSAAFFRRWEILEFGERITREHMIPDLAEKIIDQELGALLQFALDGALRLVKQGAFTPSVTHDRLLLRWRMSASSVLEFLHDHEWCQLGSDEQCNQAELFEHFTKWLHHVGRRPLGRRMFYAEIDASGSVAGVYRKVGSGREGLVIGVRPNMGAAW